MSSFHTAIFDLDGTLLDTLDDLAAAVNHALTAHGYPPRTREEVRLFVGNGVRVLMSRATPGGENNPEFLQILADFRAYYETHTTCYTRPYPGLKELLATLLTAGVRVAVVSNKFDAAVRTLCDRFFGNLVALTVGEGASLPKKPAPDMLLHAIALLGVPGEGCVYIGDSEVDLQTARNAGLPCISVSWGFRTREELMAHGATCIAADARSLAALLLPPEEKKF